MRSLSLLRLFFVCLVAMALTAATAFEDKENESEMTSPVNVIDVVLDGRPLPGQIVYRPDAGPSDLFAAVQEFVTSHGIYQGLGCDTAACFVTKLNAHARSVSGICPKNKFLDLLLSSLQGKHFPSRFHEAVNSCLNFPDFWPALALTMVPEKDLEVLRWMVETVVADHVPARVILEAGVWRGGASIFCAASLQEALEKQQQQEEQQKEQHDVDDAGWVVVLADSFKGLPLPSTSEDEDWWYEMPQLRVGQMDVRDSFAAHLPDINIVVDDGDDDSANNKDSEITRTSLASSPHVHARFFAGYVRDSMSRIVKALDLRAASHGQSSGDIAILRIDLDMGEAYNDTLFALAPRVPPGGFMVMDDYGCVTASKVAVDAFRTIHGITEPLMSSGSNAVWWRVSKRVDAATHEPHQAVFEAKRSPSNENIDARVTFNLPGVTEKFVVKAAVGEDLTTKVVETCESLRGGSGWEQAVFESVGDCVAELLPHVVESRRLGNLDYLGDNVHAQHHTIA